MRNHLGLSEFLVCDNSTNISYEYNIDGLRTKKAVQNGNTYYYYYSGDKLISMTWDNGGKSLNFLYNGAAPYSVVYYDGTYSTSYYYITNLQGDVVAIMNAQHGIVAEYVYDAWGNILAITNSNGTDISGNANHIANLNPIRYRGYFYDTETGFYYLQSRYYDPVIGRFINLDRFVTTGQGFLSYNMYAYCGNNPVVFVDPSGEWWWVIIPLIFVGCSKEEPKPDPLPYNSADDAARGFYEEVYSKGVYIAHEYATEIYSVTIDGVKTYDYSNPRVGGPHEVNVSSSSPEGTTLEAYAHTHPNSNYFSSTDKTVANNFECDAYVVGPNQVLQKYSYSSGNTTDLGTITCRPLTTNQRIRLYYGYRESWDSHLETCNGTCKYKKWPVT